MVEIFRLGSRTISYSSKSQMKVVRLAKLLLNRESFIRNHTSLLHQNKNSSVRLKMKLSVHTCSSLAYCSEYADWLVLSTTSRECKKFRIKKCLECTPAALKRTTWWSSITHRIQPENNQPNSFKGCQRIIWPLKKKRSWLRRMILTK